MSAGRPEVVIIGGGFGGLYAARALARSPVHVTVVDRTNHHLFQPLLYQVATATLAPTDITAPIRWLLRTQRNSRVLLADVTGIDVARRVVTCDDGALRLPYDYLILASGARHSYFGHPEWEKAAPGLKSIDDAIVIRHRFLMALERAEKATSDEERRRNLTFVVVGGGPTGVELAGMIPLITRHALPEEFRANVAQSRVILLEAGPRVLPAFDEKLAAHARDDLVEMGVEVRTGTAVTRVDRGTIWVGDERIETETVFWAAGNEASPLGRTLGAPLDRAGRVRVKPDLSVPDHPEVFVAGDLAEMSTDGKRVPGVAPAAMQSGKHAAHNILRLIHGRSTEPFRYRNKGDLATIGRHRAIAQFPSFQMSGNIAWWFWLFLHIMYLAGFRNRMSVLFEWAYSYFTYQRGARLIAGKR